MTLDGYNGTAGDSLIYHSGQRFVTYDNDSAPVSYWGWWEPRCDTDEEICPRSNLNGVFDEEYDDQGMT